MNAPRNTGPGNDTGAAAPAGQVAGRPEFINRRDFYLTAGLAALAVVSWCVPERHWGDAAARIYRVLRPIRRHLNRTKPERLAKIVQLVGDFPLGISPEELLSAYDASHHLETLQILRCYRPGGWHPRIRLAGEDRLQQALGPGKGAIIWVQPLAFNDVVTKMAFHRAGFRICHLSLYTHGFSHTRYGVRVLNPVRTGVENRFLAERLTMGPEGPFVPGANGPVRAMQALADRLADGNVVSITVTVGQARKPRLMPFLGGALPTGDGAIRLARRTGSALLPVFTVQEADGTFTTTIETALEVPAEGDENDVAEAVLRRYGRLLEGYAMRWPAQFRGWLAGRQFPKPPA